MKQRILFYVVYEDEDGNEESTEVLAPNEDIVCDLMRPYTVLQVVEIPDPDPLADLLEGALHEPEDDE